MLQALDVRSVVLWDVSDSSLRQRHTCFGKQLRRPLGLHVSWQEDGAGLKSGPLVALIDDLCLRHAV